MVEVVEGGVPVEWFPSMMVATRWLLEGFPFAEVAARFRLVDDGVVWLPRLVDDGLGQRVEWVRGTL